MANERSVEILLKSPYLTASEAAIIFPIPVAGIRHLIFSNSDFRKKVARKVGGKVVLDRVAFEKFLGEKAFVEKNSKNVNK